MGMLGEKYTKELPYFCPDCGGEDVEVITKCVLFIKRKDGQILKEIEDDAVEVSVICSRCRQEYENFCEPIDGC